MPAAVRVCLSVYKKKKMMMEMVSVFYGLDLTRRLSISFFYARKIVEILKKKNIYIFFSFYKQTTHNRGTLIN